jgi:hypothetical protein
MPYRGLEISGWGHDEQRALLRIVAACVLLMAGWGIGFFSGRMSAWLFPVEAGLRTAEKARANDRTPTRAPQITRPVEAVQAPAQATGAEVAKKPKPELAGAGVSRSDKPSDTASYSPADPAEAPADPPLVEPKQKTHLASPDERETKRGLAEVPLFDPAKKAALDECERRYASFRHGDGTYQPYGSRSREVCPFLRFRN